MNELFGLLAELFGKHGIGVGLIIVLCVISYLIIRHILNQSSKILDMAMSLNEKWQKCIDEHTAQASAFHNQVSEAHKYQRDEHKEMIESLQIMNANAEQRGKALDRINDNLEEQGKVLARINGIKH